MKSQNLSHINNIKTMLFDTMYNYFCYKNGKGKCDILYDTIETSMSASYLDTLLNRDTT